MDAADGHWAAPGGGIGEKLLDVFSAQAYYGGNLSRLESIKKKADPDRLFTFPQAI